MQKIDQVILRAERLRSVMAMPEYEATIGAWIKEGFREAQHNLHVAVEPYQMHRAQGYFSAMQNLQEQIDRVFELEKAAHEKVAKRKITETPS